MMNQPGRRKVLAPGTGMVFIKQIVQIQMLIRAVTGYLVGKYDTFVYPVPVSCRIMELASGYQRSEKCTFISSWIGTFAAKSSF